MYQHIIFQNNNGIARISLNRPQVHHALNQELVLEITAALKEAESDTTVRVIVLTGEGSKAFCSGADLKETLASEIDVEDILRTYYNPMILTIRQMPKPVLCRLNGLAAGAGASLALSCDVIIASDNAYLSQIFVQIGLIPDAGSTFFLPRLVGPAKAFELASTGRKVYAAEAAQMGLINQCVPEENLDQTVEEMAAYYRQAPTQAIGTMKLLMNTSFQSDLPQMLESEAIHQQRLSKSRDAQEGIASFLQKKKPDYQGK
ncbi:1,2-epoxyphenylacetyl-CoA isomerase [Dyadobacter sp. CECT 9275]|uniref:1,2-epoxyphenylacetyl-CoA isomerase n=1 Tax=Dyadobacter helix TaxID=2822344 RepID=A0A916JFF8_9BACT|nr:enoyl-CoA hydratase-related protein [Dyadobacter sp. CECT 9275]CAG5008300.1 1,2-epoxyphenylacetyl-CoA isomerase [Dyadobacter sp. CECT 9275]